MTIYWDISGFSSEIPRLLHIQTYPRSYANYVIAKATIYPMHVSRLRLRTTNCAVRLSRYPCDRPFSHLAIRHEGFGVVSGESRRRRPHALTAGPLVSYSDLGGDLAHSAALRGS